MISVTLSGTTGWFSGGSGWFPWFSDSSVGEPEPVVVAELVALVSDFGAVMILVRISVSEVIQGLMFVQKSKRMETADFGRD